MRRCPTPTFPAFVAGVGIRHSDGDAIGRGAGRSLGRNRPGRESLDGPGRANEDGARTSNPAVRPRHRHLEGIGKGANGRLRFSRPALRTAAFGHGVRNAVAAYRLALHGARLSKLVPRLGRKRDALPARTRRTCACPRRPNRLTVDRTRWRGGGSLWTLGRGIARTRPARASWRSSGRHSPGRVAGAREMDDFEQDTRSGYVYLGGYLEINKRGVPHKQYHPEKSETWMNAAPHWHVS